MRFTAAAGVLADAALVAAIVPVRRLPAIGKWLGTTPLYRLWMLTPRPSMPPGSYLAAGNKWGRHRGFLLVCLVAGFRRQARGRVAVPR